MAPGMCQKLSLRVCFNALGDHTQTQVLSQRDDGSRNGCVVGIGEDIAHKRLVNL